MKATDAMTRAELEAELDAAHDENMELRNEIEGFQIALGSDEHLHDEIKTLRGFMADVLLGIRDVSEYEDVCGRG